MVSPLWFHKVKGACMFRCNLPPVLLAEWSGSFMCHCCNRGVEWTLNKSQYTKLTLEKKILLPLLLGFELASFWSWVRRSYQQAILAMIVIPDICSQDKLLIWTKRTTHLKQPLSHVTSIVKLGNMMVFDCIFKFWKYIEEFRSNISYNSWSSCVLLMHHHVS